MTVTIIVAPIASSPGRFMAKLASDGDVLVTSSRTPFLDAARRLLELGYSADAGLVMRHAGSVVDSLRATVGTAARLTVKEKAAVGEPELDRLGGHPSPPMLPRIATYEWARTPQV